MNNSEKVFRQIANEISSASEGKLFGALSIKAKNGKNVAYLWQDCMTTKLDKESQEIALKLKGAKIGTHIYNQEKEMKGWVNIPKEHIKKWKYFIVLAIKYVEPKK